MYTIYYKIIMDFFKHVNWMMNTKIRIKIN